MQRYRHDALVPISSVQFICKNHRGLAWHDVAQAKVATMSAAIPLLAVPQRTATHELALEVQLLCPELFALAMLLQRVKVNPRHTRMSHR